MCYHHHHRVVVAGAAAVVVAGVVFICIIMTVLGIAIILSVCPSTQFASTLTSPQGLRVVQAAMGRKSVKFQASTVQWTKGSGRRSATRDEESRVVKQVIAGVDTGQSWTGF